jgi:hypothetical protein
VAVYDKPPKRSIASSRGKHRRDLISEYNKRYAEQPAQGDAPTPPAPQTDGEKT